MKTPSIPFKASTLLRNGHLQTLLGHFLKSQKWSTPTRFEILKLEDGDSIEIEYLSQSSNGTVIFMHGLGGNARSDYMERSAAVAEKMGLNVILVNHRGASSRVESQKTYHSGRGEDAAQVITWARRKFPNSRVLAVGFSMSGSILLNLLTKNRGEGDPDFACVVNAPIDLKDASDHLMKGFSRFYDLRFFYILKKIILSRHQDISIPWIGTVRDLDEIYTAKLNGFESAVDYYERCSTWKYLDRISTPTFVLTAQDDPFVRVEKYLEAKWSPAVELTIADSGGHMGYIHHESLAEWNHRWLDYYLSEVFGKCFSV